MLQHFWLHGSVRSVHGGMLVQAAAAHSPKARHHLATVAAAKHAAMWGTSSLGDVRKPQSRLEREQATWKAAASGNISL
jgi:hypothetical protein